MIPATEPFLLPALIAVRDFLYFLVLTIYIYIEAFLRIFIKPPLKSVSGEVILITGGANGIGKEIAFQLASLHAKIVVWDLNETAYNELVETLKSMKCDAYGFKVDVSSRTQVEKTAKLVEETIGHVTVLINNAGIMPCKSFLDHSPQELEQVYNVNVFGNYWTLRAFLPAMISMNKGHIVTMCSAAGLTPVRNLVPYCGSKHAIHALVEGLKHEFESMENPPNIHFTTVYPFSCSTGLLNGIQSFSRFPWLVPTVLHPKDVATKTVEGFRRNYEHVYIPSFVNFAGNGAKALLPRVQYAARDFLKCSVEPAAGF